MCTRTNIRSIHGLELETTQFSGESSEGVYLSPLQAREMVARLSDEVDFDPPYPAMYTHPTTGDEVLEYWVNDNRSTIFHLTDEGYYDVTDLSWDD